MLNSPRRRLEDVRVGFVLSHPFHFYLYRALIRAVDNPLVVIETRRQTPFAFSSDFIKELGCPYVIVDEADLKTVEGQVDVLFVMTPKHLGAKFTKTRTVIMQYGMAKEYYNYGLWRCRGDLNMMYGPYSHSKVVGHAVSYPVGNIRLDGYEPPAIGGGGLLYIPTYGELSTLSKFADALPKLNPSIPIKVKLHHASEFQDAGIVARLKDDPRITLLDGYHDAFDDICAADVVLSDYSGAIFDAIFLNRPVALFQPGYSQTVKRTDDRSLEIAGGDKLGAVLRSEDELIAFVDQFVEGQPAKSSAMSRAEFLSNPGNAVPTALDLLDKLINDEIPRSIVQTSLRDTYLKLLRRPAKPVVVGFKTALKQRISRMVFKK